MAAKPIYSPTFCKCGVPWESPCECSENVLERFSVFLKEKHNSDIFYYETFNTWITDEFRTEREDLVQKVLNLQGIVEIGDSAYMTPYVA